MDFFGEKYSKIDKKKSKMGNLIRIYIILFIILSSFQSVHCLYASIISEALDDGVVVYHYNLKRTGKSLLTRKFEKLYEVAFKSEDKYPFGRSVAFIVGVSKYENLSPQLPSVENDVNDMLDFLLNKAGFDEVYIVQNQNVTRTLIEKYIKGEFRDKLTKNDRLLFYYSGHGADNSGNTGYMQFSRAKQREFWGDSVLPINDLNDWSSELSVKHMLFLIDCCASGLAFTSKNADWQNEKILVNIRTQRARL